MKVTTLHCHKFVSFKVHVTQIVMSFSKSIILKVSFEKPWRTLLVSSVLISLEKKEFQEWSLYTVEVPLGGKKRREYKITLKLGMEMNIYLE